MSSCWILILVLPVYAYLDRHDGIEISQIHQQLALSNPAWDRVVTFILESSQSSSNLGRNDEGECCLTDHSGWWCRRQRRHEGHLHPVGDNLDSDQLGHRSALYQTTDWAISSCRTTRTEVNSTSLVLFDHVDTTMRHHVDLPAIFSVLLNFGRNHYYQFLISMLDYLETDHGCRPGYVWDPFASSCRRIYCGPDEDGGFLQEFCANNTNGTNSDWRMTYVMELDVIELTLFVDAIYDNETLTENGLIVIIEESFTPAFAAFVGIDPDRIDNVDVYFLNESSTRTLRPLAIDFWLKQAPVGSDEPTIDSIVALMGSLIIQDQLIVVMNDQVAVQLVGIHEQPVPSESDSFANWCRGGVTSIYTNDEFILDVNNNTETNQTELIVYIKATGQWYESGEYMADLFFYGTSGSSASMSGSVAVCENRSVLVDTSCTTVRLNESEYIWLDNNTILYNGSIPFIGPVLHHGDYESLPDGSLAVCLNYPDWPIGLIIESYLTVVLMSISIMAMTATIVTYSLFSELRNLAGLAVMNLCITTALFQLCVMIGMSISVHQEAELCVIASIIVHYQGLASIFWTNVMAADLYLTLGRWSAAPRSPSKILPRYALYAYGLPLIIVSISVTINFCGCTGDFTVDYGRFFCWINNPTANMIFFGLPLALALLANVILFIRTVTIIQRSSAGHQSNCTRRQKAVCQLKLYARMSTVMGFAWIFAIVAACFDPMTPAGLVFNFIYITLNAMGGLFIFVAFTCSRRVSNLYRQWWRAKRSQLRRSSTTTGESTSVTSRKTSIPGRRMKTVSVETLVSTSEPTIHM